MKILVSSSLPAASLVFMLASCASTESVAPQPRNPATALQDAAQAPLADLNLVRKKIPPVLQDAVRAPYAPPMQRSCEGLVNEVQALDAVLGADLDTPSTLTNPGLVERGSAAVGDAANDALRGAAESVIPFRGWVRKLDGAERHSKEVAAAIAAGAVRRAYLKGIGHELACLPPAAPMATSGKAPADTSR
ncbi:MAG TPA: hypothetical protein VIP05_02000 [Burkholderiaceae bacterium]